MDIISRAVENGWHICKEVKTEEHTWKSFAEHTKGKHIFLFGTAGGLEYFLRNYGRDVKIDGVVDNDKKKQNHKLGDLCGDAWRNKYGELIIHGMEVFNRYSSQEIAVIITSIKNYALIMEQLRQRGIDNCYVLLPMEQNKRKKLEYKEECFEEIRGRYKQQCCCQKIEDNKIVMLIGLYGGHARQITRALLKEGRELDIVWIVRTLDIEKPDKVRLVYENNWKNYMYEMETAKIWIFDDPVPYFFHKREGQIYIQVKHWSSITLKKFYLDDKEFCGATEEKEKIRRDGERMDYVFTGSELDEESCRRGLMFQGEAVRIGSARSDILFDKTIKEKVLTWFGLERNTKICLYAPTYRQKEFHKKSSISISLDMLALLDALKNKWGGSWRLLVRLHPCLGYGENLWGNNENILDARGYLDSEELVAASDVMIADYSSITFEGAYKKEPVFLYAPDRKEYINGERDLLIDYGTLPFPTAESNEELHNRIKEFKAEEYEKNVAAFLDSYGVHEDGHASERASKFIIGLLDGDLKGKNNG